MLETFREHSKGWLAKLILALITVPFALWGIDSYLQQSGSSVAVAEVDGHEITVQEYSNALQNLRARMQSEKKVDPTLLEDPAVAQSVLDHLVESRLMQSAAQRSGFTLGDAQLGTVILAMPEFQRDGKFSQEMYDELLKQNRMTPSQFEARMRQDMLTQQIRSGAADAAFQTQAGMKRLLDVENERREVSVHEIKAADFMSGARVEAAAVKAFYEKNKERFRVPEAVRIEYLILSASNLIPSMQVSTEDAKKYYAENAAKFQGDEQRRASHILITFGKGDAAAKEAAKKKAEQILTEIKKSPSLFGALAKTHSQDPGSAVKEGDLGLFGRGMMVKPFEEAVFGMAPGAISGLVESEFGYHIIKLTEIQGKSQSFDEAKPNILAELMYQKALAKFAEQAENFSNMVYEQSDSLQPAAKAFGVQVQSSPWMTREELQKFFKNDKLVNIIFSAEVLKDKRNTEAVEAAPNTLVAARVVEHRPATPKNFEEVSPGIETYLKNGQALTLAAQRGQEMLEALRAGRDVPGLRWTSPTLVGREDAQGLSGPVMQGAYRIDAAKMPGYSGVESKPAGYTLIRVTRLENQAPEDSAETVRTSSAARAMLAEEYTAAYLKSLKGKADITVNRAVMDSGSRQ